MVDLVIGMGDAMGGLAELSMPQAGFAPACPARDVAIDIRLRRLTA
jgi:hypothetical protein